MHKIDGAGHVGNLFVERDPVTGQQPTIVTAEWLNAVQTELVNLIEAAGFVLSKPDNTQLRQAVQRLASWSTGDVKMTLKAVADTGWVMMNDGSIGDALSGGTTRANADTEALFTLLWNNISNAWAPTQDSAGAPIARGANAAVDFAAHRRIVLPKVLGRALAVAGAGSGLTARVLGQTAGAETHVLTTAEMPAHDHRLKSTTRTGDLALDQASNDGVAGWDGVTGGFTSGGGADLVEDTGGGGAHNNVQPTSFLNVMIKL